MNRSHIKVPFFQKESPGTSSMWMYQGFSAIAAPRASAPGNTLSGGRS
jgi:hypothetical protein